MDLLTSATIITSPRRNIPGLQKPLEESSSIVLIQASVPEPRHHGDMMGAALIGLYWMSWQ